MCVIPHSDTSAASTFAKFSAAFAAGKTECQELLACIKWHVTARYVSVLIGVHISDELTADALDTMTMAFSLDVCPENHSFQRKWGKSTSFFSPDEERKRQYSVTDVPN